MKFFVVYNNFKKYRAFKNKKSENYWPRQSCFLVLWTGKLQLGDIQVFFK